MSCYEPPFVTVSGTPQYEPQSIFSTQDSQHHMPLPLIANQVEPTNTSHNSYAHTGFPVSPGHYPRSPRIYHQFRAITHEWASTSFILKAIIQSCVKLSISLSWPIQDQYTLNLGRRDCNHDMPAHGTTLWTSPLLVQPYGPPCP